MQTVCESYNPKLFQQSLQIQLEYLLLSDLPHFKGNTTAKV